MWKESRKGPACPALQEHQPHTRLLRRNHSDNERPRRLQSVFGQEEEALVESRQDVENRFLNIYNISVLASSCERRVLLSTMCWLLTAERECSVMHIWTTTDGDIIAATHDRWFNSSSWIVTMYSIDACIVRCYSVLGVSFFVCLFSIVVAVVSRILVSACSIRSVCISLYEICEVAAIGRLARIRGGCPTPTHTEEFEWKWSRYWHCRWWCSLAIVTISSRPPFVCVYGIQPQQRCAFFREWWPLSGQPLERIQIKSVMPCDYVSNGLNSQ